jgi:hypothetical protein
VTWVVMSRVLTAEMARNEGGKCQVTKERWRNICGGRVGQEAYSSDGGRRGGTMGNFCHRRKLRVGLEGRALDLGLCGLVSSLLQTEVGSLNNVVEIYFLVISISQEF